MMEEVQEAANGKSDLDQRHIRNTRTRVCKRCKFSTANAKEFLHHQISAHDEDMEVHGCDKCDFVTSSYPELICHKRNHRRSSNASLRKMSTDSETGFIDDSNNNDKTLGVAAGSISMTTTSASTRDAMTTMVNGHERPNPHASARADTDSPIPIGQNEFECAECDVTTSSAKTYFWHLKEEHGATFDVFECSQCDFATRDRSLLARHQSGHTNNDQDSADESVSAANAESLNGDPIPPKVIEIVPDSVQKGINNPPSDIIPDDMKSSTSIIGDLINRVSGGNPELSKASFMGKMELTYGGPAVFPNGFGSGERKNEQDALLVDDRRHSLPNFSTPKNNPLYPQQPPFLKVSHSSLEKSKPAGVKTMTPGATTKPKTGCAPVREAVDPAKYVTIQEPDGTKYACSKCGNIYKWRKSLNKHWKEKHDGEIPDPRPNYTALNIPRLKATMGGTPPGSVLKEVHSGMDASAARQVAASRAALMSGGDVKMGEISNKSPALRRALKRPAMTGEPPFSVGLSLPNKPTETNSLLKYSHGVQVTSTMLHPSQTIVTDDHFSNYNALKSLHATSANLAKYDNTQGTSTIKQHTIQKTRHLVSHRGHHPSRESPMDLSKQIQQGKLAFLNDDHHSDGEGALDLSKGSAGIIHISKQPKMMSVIDVDQLPQQDEPLDFSMKPTKPEPALKQEEMFRLVPEQTGSLALQCPSCAYIARNKQDYDNHMELHLRKRHHKCAECQQVFFTMTELNYHFSNEHAKAIDERMMTGGNGQRMLVPGKVQEATQLYKYLTMDSQGQLLTCMVCGTIFQWQWTLAKHFSEDHPTLPNPYTKKSGSASTTSPNSSAGSAEPSPAKRQKLNEDMDEGPPGNPLQCHQCAFVAGSNSELARHQLKHSIARQYVCRVCSFTTRWKDQLISHYKQNHPTASIDLTQISMHTIHDQVTPPPSSLSHSMMDMTPEDGTTIVIPQAPEDSDNDQHSSGPEDSLKTNNMEAQQQGVNNSAEILLPFKCSVCEYRARWPSEITQHMKNHSDEKPYLCPRCSYRSKWKWDVVKHLKRCGGGTVKDVIDTTKHRKQRQIQALLADVIPATNLKVYKPGTTHSPGSGREVLSNGPPNVTVVPAVQMNQCMAASLDLSASSGYEDSIYEHGHMSDESESYNSDHQQISAGSGDDGGNNSSSYNSLLGQGQHFCLHCPFVGNSPAELKRHSRVHSDEKPFICKTCGYCSKWKCDLKKHLRTYNHTSAVPLTYGGHGRKPSDWKDSLSKSAEKQEAEFGEEQEEDKEAEDSRRMSLPTLYKCDKCQYVTYKKNVLESHMKIHRQTNVTLGSSGSGKLKCKQCDFNTNDLISFVQHKLTHSSQQTSESALNMVDGNAQEKQETNNNDPTTESNVLAPDAAVAVKHRRKPLKGNRILTALGSDMYEHTSKVDEDFDDLGCKAEEASEPSSHMALDFSRKTLPVGTVAPMVQEGSKKVSRLPNYKCTYCPYTTDNKCNFEKHTRFHNTPNKYTCEWCNWSIDRLNLLYRHAQIVHPEELALQEKETFFGKVRGRKSSPGLGLLDRDSASREFGDNSEGNTDRYDTDDICDESDGARDLLGVRRRLSMSGKRPREDGEDENRSKRRRRLKTCQKCGYITDNVTTLQRHMAKHGSMGKFTCTYCDYSVDRQHIVDYHMKIVHLCQDDALRLQAAEDERQTLLAEGMKKKAIVGGQVEDSDIEKDLVIAVKPDEVEQLDKDVDIDADDDVGKLVIATDPEVLTEDPEEMMTEDQLEEEMTEDPEEMTEESEAIEEEDESFVPIIGPQTMSALSDKIHTVKDGEIVEEEMVDQVSGKTKKVLWEITKIKGHRMKVQRVGNKTTYHCLQCPFITKNITNSANHMRQHGAKKKYVCEYCDYSLDQLRHIMAHMKNVHGAQGTYIEGDDSLEGENISSFNDTTEEEEFVKDENEENIDINSKDLHFIGKRSGSLTPKSHNPRKAVTNPGSPKSNGHTRYRCNRCSFVTQVQASWKRHMESHKRFGPKLQCRGCDYKATTAKLMRQHLRAQHSHKAVAIK